MPKAGPSGASWRRNSLCRRGASDRCEGCRPCATGITLDVAVRAVRTRLPPRSRSGIRNGWRPRPRPTGHALRPLCETLPTGAIVAGDEFRTDAAKCTSHCCACVKGCPSAHAATIPSHPCCRAISRNASATSRSCRACTTYEVMRPELRFRSFHADSGLWNSIRCRAVVRAGSCRAAGRPPRRSGGRNCGVKVRGCGLRERKTALRIEAERRGVSPVPTHSVQWPCSA